MTDTLLETVTETHDVLCTRLADAASCRPTVSRPRDLLSATDPFLASTSRHVGAATAVLAPAIRRHLDGGRQRARDFSRQGRRLEDAMFWTKAKLYGSSFAARVPWSVVWHQVEDEFAAFWELEESLVNELAAASPDDTDRLAERLYRSEKRMPTRPHPHLPHLGISGRTTRAVARRVDGFWDTAEGRMTPEPVRPPRDRSGLMARYLLADPHVEETD